jgi:hypothetical protein
MKMDHFCWRECYKARLECWFGCRTLKTVKDGLNINAKNLKPEEKN